MDTATLTLTDFLLARISEDEAEYAATRHDDDLAQSADFNEGYIIGLHKRLRAECEAKRRIVELAGYVLESWSANHGGPGRSLWPDVNRRERHTANENLYALARPYADHPDCREEWKP